MNNHFFNSSNWLIMSRKKKTKQKQSNIVTYPSPCKTTRNNKWRWNELSKLSCFKLESEVYKMTKHTWSLSSSISYCKNNTENYSILNQIKPFHEKSLPFVDNLLSLICSRLNNRCFRLMWISFQRQNLNLMDG